MPNVLSCKYKLTKHLKKGFPDFFYFDRFGTYQRRPKQTRWVSAAIGKKGANKIKLKIMSTITIAIFMASFVLKRQ
jgi:hypothetical protein